MIVQLIWFQMIIQYKEEQIFLTQEKKDHVSSERYPKRF